MRIVDFFSGIGGLSAALAGATGSLPATKVVAAYDIDRLALEIGAANFGTPIHAREIESIARAELAVLEADLWWLSPPCQPYTVKGKQRDLEDPRAQSLLALLDRIADIRPAKLALENVPGFQESRARARLLETVAAAGYAWREELLCPTSLGISGRRLRYYFVATRAGELLPRQEKSLALRPLADFVEAADDEAWLVPERITARFGAAMHRVDRGDPAAIANCFTSSYGESPLKSGSYLRCIASDRLRYFSPREIARLLGFPASFRFPEGLSPRRLWSLVGNSISADAVGAILAPIL